MLRIKTTIGNDRVYTLFFNGKWVTLWNIKGKSDSTDAPSLQEAGFNHLAACQKVLDKQPKEENNGS